jgi:hypothetical protein
MAPPSRVDGKMARAADHFFDALDDMLGFGIFGRQRCDS